MPKFAANLSLMYTEAPFLDRFALAARDGFRAVECMFPYAWPMQDIRARLNDHGLQLVLFNAPPAGADLAAMRSAWDDGERGVAALPGREAEFRAGLTHALACAQQLGCQQVHVLAGRVPPGLERERLQPTYLDNLRWAVGQAAAAGVRLLIEPINLRDMPRYFLNRQDHAHEIMAALPSPHLKVQMDLYHCQIVEGDVAMKLRKYLAPGQPSDVAHVQIASVPERQEPDSGELHLPYLFALLDELGYTGWVGCEYRPRLGTQPGGTTAGLGWRTAWDRHAR